jgi:hypothetical protein
VLTLAACDTLVLARYEVKKPEDGRCQPILSLPLWDWGPPCLGTGIRELLDQLSANGGKTRKGRPGYGPREWERSWTGSYFISRTAFVVLPTMGLWDPKCSRAHLASGLSTEWPSDVRSLFCRSTSRVSALSLLDENPRRLLPSYYILFRSPANCQLPWSFFT